MESPNSSVRVRSEHSFCPRPRFFSMPLAGIGCVGAYANGDGDGDAIYRRCRVASSVLPIVVPVHNSDNTGLPAHERLW